MKPKQYLPTIAAILAISSMLVTASANAQSLIDKLNEFGPEAKALAQRSGTWDVTITSWEGPKASPSIERGLVAERRMIGPMLEEVLRPQPGGSGVPFSRADFLTFNKLEGRWQYMSMDDRAPVGMMTAYSLDADPENKIFMSFLPFANASVIGNMAIGNFWRMEQVISRQDDDHEIKDQYFTVAGTSPVKWLGIRYSYTRRK